MTIETVHRAKLTGPMIDVTVYSGQFGDKMAVKATLVVTGGGLTQLDFVHPQTGQVLDSWKDEILNLKRQDKIYTLTREHTHVYELPILNGYASKICILARGLEGSTVELRLQINGPFPAGNTNTHNVTVIKHFYKGIAGTHVKLNTCGNRNISRFYLTISDILLYADDRIVVSKCVDGVDTIILHRCLGDILDQQLMEIELPQAQPVKELNIELLLTKSDSQPGFNLIIPIIDTVTF